MNHARWTPSDVERLRELRTKGLTIAQIAVALDRTHFAVRVKLTRSGLRRRGHAPGVLRCMRVLRENAHRFTTAAEIAAAIGAWRPPALASSSVRAVIRLARQRGYVIESKYGHGYRLVSEPASKSEAA